MKLRPEDAVRLLTSARAAVGRPDQSGLLQEYVDTGGKDAAVAPAVRDFPRTVWILWYQGWENAPELAKRCLRSWQYHNPGWTIRTLDGENLSAYIDLSDLALPMERNLTWLSDLVRMNLLRTHGGVWVDATTFCRRPLDQWLFDYLDSGFFAFARKGRATGSFLVSVPGNPLVNTWRNEMHAYWMDSAPQAWRSPIHPSIPEKLLDVIYCSSEWPRRAIAYPLYFLRIFRDIFPGFPLSPFCRKTLKITPHYWMSFIFRQCCKKHRHFRSIWNQTPKLRMTGLVELGGLAGLVKPISADRKRILDEGLIPVYKLNWRLDLAEVVPGTFAHCLFATIPGDEQ